MQTTITLALLATAVAAAAATDQVVQQPVATHISAQQRSVRSKKASEQPVKYLKAPKESSNYIKTHSVHCDDRDWPYRSQSPPPSGPPITTTKFMLNGLTHTIYPPAPSPACSR
jgi:hypothetical protein